MVAAPARFGRGGQDTSKTSRRSFGTCAACCHGMCRGHAHGEKEGTVAADHRILVWRRIARRCCRHPCHLRVRRTIGTNGAGCSGMYWCVCGLVCGALSGRAVGWRTRRTGKAVPQLGAQRRAAAHPQSSPVCRHAFSQEHALLKQCALLWQFLAFGVQRCAPKGGLKREKISKMPPTALHSTPFQRNGC